MTLPTSIQVQLNHRTIRKFKEKKLTKETIELLLNVANRSATSNGMQNYSIIIVDDPFKREEISQVCKQEHVKQAPFFMIFVVDTHRNNAITNEVGVDLEAFKDMDRFFQGFTDAVISAQSMVDAAESLGLGTNYFGSILNDAEKIIEILELPKLTMPVVGLGIGYPNQEPMLKPRIPIQHKVFYNTYKKESNYSEAFIEYDKALEKYYDLRDLTKPVGKFSDQLVSKHKVVNEKRVRIAQVIEKQGFDLKLDK